MSPKLEEYISFFNKTNGTGLLIAQDITSDFEIKQYLSSHKFKTITYLSDISPNNASYVMYFKKDALKYIYSIYKQLSDGLTMIQSKHPKNFSDEIITIDKKNFRLLLVMTKEDLIFAQNLLTYDFINLAGMIEYI